MALSDGVLTLLATVKTELSISASTDDTYLERLIETASDMIEAYCNRTFSYTAAIVETVRSYGFTDLRVSRMPLKTITSITLDGSTVSSSNYTLHNANAGIIHSRYGWGWSAAVFQAAEYHGMKGTERAPYTVTYNGGFVCPAQTGTRDLPYDIEDACIQLVAARYRSRGRDPYVTSETIGAASESRGGTATAESYGLPDQVKLILNRYRRTPSAAT